MTMICEKETILKGLVMKTADYDTGKKIIGISSANLTPNEAGNVPLSKETAFVKPTLEEVHPNSEIVESLNFVPSETENQEKIQESNPLDTKDEIQESNPLLESDPLADINPQRLNEIEVDIFKGIETIPEEKVEEKVPVVSTDLEMPVMEQVIAQEPDSVNEDLFASLPSLENLTQEQTLENVTTPESVVETIEEPLVPVDVSTPESVLSDLPLLTEEENLPQELPKELPEHLPIQNEAQPKSTEEKVEQNLNEKELLLRILEQLKKNNEMMQNILNEISEIKSKNQTEVSEMTKTNNIRQSMIIPSMEPQETTLTL